MHLISSKGFFVKKAILILVLIGGLVVGGSYQVGKVIEAELPNILTRAGALGQMQINIRSYERNIFRSTVRTEIVLASVSGSREQVFLRHDIWHGPLPFGLSRNGNWELTPMSALVETTIDRDTPPSGRIGHILELCPELYDSLNLTRLDFAANGTSTFTVPPFEKSFGEGEAAFRINWGGATGTADIDKSMQNMRGEVLVPPFKMTTADGYVAVDASRSDFRIFEEFGGLLLGNFTADTQGIDIRTRGDHTQFSELQFRNTAKLEEDQVSYSIAIAIASMQAGNKTYGPAGFEVDFVGLDAATILEVQKKLQSIQTQVKTLNEQEIARRVIGIYAEALPTLMKNNPEIRLNYLNLVGPGGEFWCKGNVRFENRLNHEINDIDTLLATIRAAGESQVSKALLANLANGFMTGQLGKARAAGQLGDMSDDQFLALVTEATNKQLAQLEGNGIIVADRDNYRIDFSYADRRAILNGKPLPP